MTSTHVDKQRRAKYKQFIAALVVRRLVALHCISLDVNKVEKNLKR